MGSAIRAHDQTVATTQGLTPLQLRVLRLVAVDPARIGWLGARLDVTQPTVSDAVRTLETKGLIQRTADPDDRRAAQVRVTANGRKILDQAPAPTTLLGRSLDAMTIEDKTAALTVVLGLIADLSAAGILGVTRICLTCTHFRPDAHPDHKAPHHCALLDMALARHDLRVDCPEHQPAPNHP